MVRELRFEIQPCQRSASSPLSAIVLAWQGRAWRFFVSLLQLPRTFSLFCPALLYFLSGFPGLSHSDMAVQLHALCLQPGRICLRPWQGELTMTALLVCCVVSHSVGVGEAEGRRPKHDRGCPHYQDHLCTALLQYMNGSVHSLQMGKPWPVWPTTTLPSLDYTTSQTTPPPSPPSPPLFTNSSLTDSLTSNDDHLHSPLLPKSCTPRR